jgi:Zn-dependent protease/predicted transcriptional regulator
MGERGGMGGFRLGSVLGFDIRIDYSWFIIFFLILWTFSTGVFPAVFPEQERSTYLIMGAVGTLLFFVSLLAHELSHSVVARRKGIPVEGITLFIFGGMAHTKMEFEDPGDEFQIAGVGPVSSLVIAGMFWLIAWGGDQVGWPVAVTGVAAYLAFINLALAIFNLLPGFPLDGGRLFRAAVWKYSGDLTKATRWASNGGKVLGYALMAFGVFNFFAGNLIGGLWMLFIGWFVRLAAEASFAQHRLTESFKGVRAADAMTQDPATVPADITLQEFIEHHVFQGRHHSYPVVDHGRPLGLITLERVKSVPREEWTRRAVRDAMVPAEEGVVVHPQEEMSDVLEKLSASKARRVLVSEGGELVGIITQSDIARWMERVRLMERR